MMHCIQQFCKDFYDAVVLTTNPAVPTNPKGDKPKAADICVRCVQVGHACRMVADEMYAAMSPSPFLILTASGVSVSIVICLVIPTESDAT